jgi:G3E family GTPase
VAAAAALLRPLAPRAALAEARHGDLPIAVALGEHAAGPRAPPDPARHAADFATLTLRPRRPVDPTALRAALDAAPEGLLRAKGILPLADGGHMLVQRVGRRLELTPQGGGPAALVLIGTGTAPWEAAEALRPLGLA